MNLPTFIIAGAPKCGTTALWNYLSRHPEVGMARIKEPRFFSDAVGELENGKMGSGHLRSGQFSKGIDWYKSLFDSSADKLVRGEASTQYFSVPNSPQLIKMYIPDVKLIFMLRHPVDRAYSHYLQERKLGLKLPDFGTLVETNHPRLQYYLYVSAYKQHLSNYLAHFPRKNILILLDSELKSKPLEVLSRVSEFLGISPAIAPEGMLGQKFNVQREPKVREVQYLITMISEAKFSKKMPNLIKSRLQPIVDILRKLNSYECQSLSVPKELWYRLINKYHEDIDFLKSLIEISLENWKQYEPVNKANDKV